MNKQWFSRMDEDKSLSADDLSADESAPESPANIDFVESEVNSPPGLSSFDIVNTSSDSGTY